VKNKRYFVYMPILLCGMGAAQRQSFFQIADAYGSLVIMVFVFVYKRGGKPQ
jgi:hypothetical protein